MDKQKIYEKMNAIFREILMDDSIELKPETTADDIEDWDSLAHIQLIVAIEKDFTVRFNTGEVAGLSNVGEMVSLIQKRVND